MAPRSNPAGARSRERPLARVRLVAAANESDMLGLDRECSMQSGVTAAATDSFGSM
jgi:hypothetical protein